MLVQVLINVRRYICKSARVFVIGSSDVAVILEKFGSDISEKKDKCELTGWDNRLGLTSWSYTTFPGLSRYRKHELASCRPFSCQCTGEIRISVNGTGLESVYFTVHRPYGTCRHQGVSIRSYFGIGPQDTKKRDIHPRELLCCVLVLRALR